MRNETGVKVMFLITYNNLIGVKNKKGLSAE